MWNQCTYTVIYSRSCENICMPLLVDFLGCNHYLLCTKKNHIKICISFMSLISLPSLISLMSLISIYVISNYYVQFPASKISILFSQETKDRIPDSFPKCVTEGKIKVKRGWDDLDQVSQIKLGQMLMSYSIRNLTRMIADYSIDKNPVLNKEEETIP